MPSCPNPRDAAAQHQPRALRQSQNQGAPQRPQTPWICAELPPGNVSARGVVGKTLPPVGPRATKSSPALLHPPPAALNGKGNPCPCRICGETEARGCTQSPGSCPALTHRARAGSVRGVQVSAEHRPCKAIGKGGGQRQLGNTGSREEEEGGTRGRKADGNQRRRIPGEKSPGRKRAAFLVIGFGNNIQADPFPLGSSQAARGARSEAHGSENTAAILFQALLRDTGPALRGREPPACETPHL